MVGMEGSPLNPLCARAPHCAHGRSFRSPGRANRPQDALLFRPSSPSSSYATEKAPIGCFFCWWGWRGSNPRPLRCERSALTSWATSPNIRYFNASAARWQAPFFRANPNPRFAQFANMHRHRPDAAVRPPLLPTPARLAAAKTCDPCASCAQTARRLPACAKLWQDITVYNRPF